MNRIKEYISWIKNMDEIKRQIEVDDQQYNNVLIKYHRVSKEFYDTCDELMEALKVIEKNKKQIKELKAKVKSLQKD